MKLSVHEQMLKKVAEALPDNLRNQVVFLGGSVVSLLITDTAITNFRPTKDVDIIINPNGRTHFYNFEKQLRQAGWRQTFDDDPPLICRWRINEVDVDIMPCDESILGFSNRWYRAAIKNHLLVNIGGIKIKVVTAPYFLATKIEAFQSRGKNDFLVSHDLEDVITVIDGRSEIVEEIKKSEIDLRTYLTDIFKSWLRNHNFINILPGLLEPDTAGQARFSIIIARMTKIANIK